MYPYLFCADGTSHILAHLNECQNIHNLYLVSIYIWKMRKLFSKETLSIHTSKMMGLMLEIDPKQNIKEILRILLFYIQLSSETQNWQIMKQILLFIADAIPNMSNEELQRVANVRLKSLKSKNNKSKQFFTLVIYPN